MSNQDWYASMPYGHLITEDVMQMGVVLMGRNGPYIVTLGFLHQQAFQQQPMHAQQLQAYYQQVYYQQMYYLQGMHRQGFHQQQQQQHQGPQDPQMGQATTGPLYIWPDLPFQPAVNRENSADVAAPLHLPDQGNTILTPAPMTSNAPIPADDQESQQDSQRSDQSSSNHSAINPPPRYWPSTTTSSPIQIWKFKPAGLLSIPAARAPLQEIGDRATSTSHPPPGGVIGEVPSDPNSHHDHADTTEYRPEDRVMNDWRSARDNLSGGVRLPPGFYNQRS
ncbi:MAG: hypothetical protein M1823_004190 [Watsoniomyces obsoletus]|nr:MAG: hypothetical protein M1823_004190 [Watsoniomyces obsoletus]